MKRRHFLKALAAVGGVVTLAPRLAFAATLEEATRPYVIQSPVPTSAAIGATLAEYGQFVKVSDLIVPATVWPVAGPAMRINGISMADPLTQYGIQGWKVAYLSKIIEPQHRAAVLANLARPLPARRLPRATE